MTKHTEQKAERNMDEGAGLGRNAGSRQRGGARRARGWIAALALLALGATGGALTTIAIDADAHGGWRQAMGGFRHHGLGHGRAIDPARVTERLQHASAWALGRVDATDEQRERIDAILAEAVDDVFPLRAEHLAHRRDLIAELARPQLDRAALEEIRTAELALAEKATARLLDTVVAVAEVLDTEQRQQLVERMARKHRH